MEGCGAGWLSKVGEMGFLWKGVGLAGSVRWGKWDSYGRVWGWLAQ